MKATVIGGGLAGCEAAWQLAKNKINVTLYEMKPNKKTPAHHLDLLGELVCSNSLRADTLENGAGLLKAEMRLLGSLVTECADLTKVPAGGALAVDRVGFAEMMTDKIRQNPYITVIEEEITKYLAPSAKASNGATVKGVSGILVRFAGCCNPVPGDDIVGFISRGHGVAVHRRDCPNLKGIEEDRLIEVDWANRSSSSYNAIIKVIGESQTSILTSVATAVASLKLEIVATNGRNDTRHGQAVVDFNIRLNGKDELETLIEKIKKYPKIVDVYRTTG